MTGQQIPTIWPRVRHKGGHVNPAGGRHEYAGDEIEKRFLALSTGTDDGAMFPLPHL
jgi:hypothetical protein